ncbi:hypothetical protein EP7_000521 [Isosphaeraceae bacterium EP7]
MPEITGRPRIAFLALLTAMTTGCGGGTVSDADPDAAAIEVVSLNEVAENYRGLSIFKKAPPKSVKEFTSNEMLMGAGTTAVRDGQIIVQWGSKLPDTNEEPGKVPSPEILAYYKEVPESGGYVLLLDRTVKKMTADEFKAASKAGNPSTK